MNTRVFGKHALVYTSFVVVGLLVLGAGLLTSLSMNRTSQDIRSEATAGVATFTVAGDSARLTANQEKTFPITVETGGMSVSAAVVALKVNPALVSISKLEAGDKLSVVLQQAVIDQAAGTARITLGAPPNQAFAGTGTVASITVKAKAGTGVSKIEFDSAQLQAAALNSQTNVAQAGGTSSVSVGAVPAGEVSIGAATCGTTYKAGTAIPLTATVTGGTPTSTTLFIAKLTPDGKDLVDFAGGCPAGQPSGGGAVKQFCNVAVGTSPVAFSWTPTEQQVGKYVVLMNAIDQTNGVQCSANPKCGYSSDSPLNKYPAGSCQGWVDCSAKDFAFFEVVSASSCTTTPTATPPTGTQLSCGDRFTGAAGEGCAAGLERVDTGFRGSYCAKPEFKDQCKNMNVLDNAKQMCCSVPPTKEPLACGAIACNELNPCGAGMTCVQSAGYQNGSNLGVCAKNEYITACQNAAFLSLGTACCTAPTAAPTVPPTAPPTAVPTVPPTAVPTATPPVSAYIKASFKLQGLRKAGVAIPTEFVLKYTIPGQTTAKTIPSTQTITSGTDGLLTSDIISLSEPAFATLSDATLPAVEVYAKTSYSLTKKIGTIPVVLGQTKTFDSTVELPVGDFNQEGTQKNVFNILDISKMQGAYLELTNTLTDSNRPFDVNYDGVYDLLDLSLVIGNFQRLELPGDQP